MDNHYHLLVETPDGNLSKGMRQLNGVYTQRFNRKHKRVGHVFQGRYKAIIVQKNSYLAELARYIVLNPVRAEMVRSARDWPWSSYRATADMADGPLDHYARKHPDCNEAIMQAYASGGYGMKEIGDHFGLHYSRVSRIIAQMERAKEKT